MQGKNGTFEGGLSCSWWALTLSLSRPGQTLALVVMSKKFMVIVACQETKRTHTSIFRSRSGFCSHVADLVLYNIHKHHRGRARQ